MRGALALTFEVELSWHGDAFAEEMANCLRELRDGEEFWSGYFFCAARAVYPQLRGEEKLRALTLMEAFKRARREVSP